MTDHATKSLQETKSSQEIAREAEATRMNLAVTLDELRDRMTPGVVMEEVWGFARDGGSTLAVTFLRAARANPVPALLIGAGCYLFARGTGSSGARQDGRGRRGRRFEGTLRPGAEGYIAARGSFAGGREGYGRGEGYGRDEGYGRGDEEGLLARAKRAGSRAYGRASHGAEDALDEGREYADAAQRRAMEAAESARRAAGGAYAGAADAAMSARDRVAGTAASAAHAASDAAGDLAASARGAAARVGDTASSAAEAAQDAAASAAGAVRGAASSAAAKVTDAASAVTGTVSGLGSAAASAASTVKGTVTSAYATTADAFEAGYREASRRAGYASRSAIRGAYHAQSDARDLASRAAQEQPLLVAGLGIAIGAALGALLPSTRAEARVMGDASDALKRQAADLASEGVDRAKVVVERTVEQVREEAGRQGLTPDLVTGLAQEVTDRVKTVASAAVSTAKSEAAQAAGLADGDQPARGPRSANG